jgi:hypothetical protein
MSAEEKRGSDRIVPMVSDEEMVVVECGESRYLAKMMDLSDSGTLVYLLADTDVSIPFDTLCRLSLYHNGKILTTSATVARTNGRLVAFRFRGIDYGTSANLQAKLIRMEVEWIRLQGLLEQ